MQVPDERDLLQAGVTAKDAAIIGIVVFRFAFINSCKEDPKAARELKEMYLSNLKKLGLSYAAYEGFEKYMTAVCDIVEKG